MSMLLDLEQSRALVSMATMLRDSLIIYDFLF